MRRKIVGETTARPNVPLILVVDDDGMIRRMVRRVLESKDYAVEEAEDGAQALSAFERLQPDIVLLDIMMPEMDGFATLARLQALPGGDRTPVLMITALDDKASVDRAFEAGAADYITKPIHWDVLRHRVHHLLHARQAEEALRESEESLRTIFEAAENVSFITTDLAGTEARILDFSPGAECIFGYSREEVIGKPVAMLHLPKDVTKFPEVIESMRQRKAGFTGEATLVRKSGEKFSALFTTYPIFDVKGNMTAALGVSIDITERKQAEEALRARTYELGKRAKELNCLYGLSNLVEKPGISLEEILQGTVDLIPHAWQYPEITCARIIVKGQEYRTEDFRKSVWKQTGDIFVHGERVGTLEVCYLEEKPEADEGPFLKEESNLLDAIVQRLGRIIGRKQAEEALRASEAKYRELVQNASSIIMRMDTQGHITFFNEFAQSFFGYTKDEILGQNVVDTIVPERETSGRDLVAMIQDIMQHPEQYTTNENENVRRNGERVWIAWTNKAIFDDEGRVTGILSIGNDITERKRLEEWMRQQDRMAALGRLAGGIAHDFNNILTGITLSAQVLLVQRHLPPDLAPDVESIFADAQRAARLMQQIMDFSRRSYFETRPVDLRLIIQGSANLLRRTLSENIRFLLEVRRGECVVNADPARMEQVLMNLALNAQDAMPEGGELRIGLSRVEVSSDEEIPVEEMPPPGEWICLTVSDTGKGILPEAMPRLFEPFFTTKPVGEGTGMGLAQVHGIVKQHEGHIGVETEVGQGTTFRVYLPAQGAGETEEVPLEEAPSVAPGQEEKTILLVEDEKKVRKFSQKALELLGYRVLTAADGREALDFYRSAERACPEQGRGIDLVLTDIVMPEMGGRELMRELRQANPGIRGVAMTGHALGEDLRELREEGIVDVIHKPFDLGTLEEVVRHALDGD
jgi:two-component system cell cycle sensor histidine kinase/response regulator CckA